MFSVRAWAAAAILVLAPVPADAAEGMWTFDNVPIEAIRQSLGVTLDKPWLDHLSAASVRLTTGCSGAVVSDEGLVLTNDHCVMDCLQDLSAEGRDYYRDGFAADAREGEARCSNMHAEVLDDIIDVTGKVNRATRGLAGAEFVRRRDAALASMERSACTTWSGGYRCHAVNFYRGGQYKIYKYRRYDDVRLVFAPEFAAAFFGGDPDNFNFPRYALDAAFIRLYDGGRPARTREHLAWSTAAPKAGEPVFVAGNPGSTQRLATLAQLQTLRDLTIPIDQMQRSELRGRLIEFGRRGPEQARQVAHPLFSVENSFKVYYGRQFVLNDAAFMADKAAAEADLRAKIAADPVLAAETGDPWAEVAAAQDAYARHYLPYRQLEAAAGKGSQLFAYARAIVRAAREREKPEDERLPEWTASRLRLAQAKLLEPQPIHPALEALFLEHWLAKSREYLTVDDPAVRLLLGKESPQALAERLASGTKLADPAARKALWDGGLKAVEASDDPLIVYVLAMDAAARQARQTWEEEVEGPIDRAGERIARARLAVYGEGAYPDATFTLRLSYGQVKGWTYRGRTIAPFTTFAGLYDRATGAAPYALAPRWAVAKDRLDPATVFDFAADTDIIGGNSGSPVVNAAGEILGAAFDGNIHSLGGAYGFDPELNRTVVVSTAAITEALEKVYGREALVTELTGR